MCECGRLFSSALLTALVIMSGEVKGVSVDCDRDVTSGSGGGVLVQAACYPNGTVSYSWNSDPSTWHLLVEYQCYNNGSTHEQTPDPVRARQLSWSDHDSGDDTFSVLPWEEGTSCVFSGCYDDSVERGFPTYRIPDTTCTVVTIMTSSSALIMSSSPGPHMASSQPLLPTPTTLPPPSPTTRSLSRMQLETSTTVQPDSGNQVLLVTVPVVAVLIVMVTAVCLPAVLILVIVKKRSERRPRLKVANDMLKGDFAPVSLAIREPILPSLETLLNVLETPCSHTHLLDYDHTPKTYLRHAPPKRVEAQNSLFLESAEELSDLNSILVPPDGGSTITESAIARISDGGNDSIGTLKTSEEEGNETMKVIVPTEADSLEEERGEEEEKEEEKEEEEEDEKEEEEEEEEEEEGGREQVCSDLSGHVSYTQDTSGAYESLELKLCDLPGGEFPLCKPFMLGPRELTSMDASLVESFSVDSDYLHPPSHLQTNTSGSSGYVTDLSLMNSTTPALESVDGEV